MFLSRFGVKNYKCLAEIDIPLTPIHVLIGPNDAGKTSLLEAMAAFHASPEKPLPEIFPKPWSGRELVFHGQPQGAVELWGEWQAGAAEEESGPGAFRYGFSVQFPPQGTDCFAETEWFELNGTREDLHREGMRRKVETVVKWWTSEGRRPQGVSQEHLDILSQTLKPAHKYSFDPKVMALSAAINPQRKFVLDPDGFGLSTLLQDILNYDAALFINLRTEFCRLLNHFRTVRLESEQGLIRHYEGGTAQFHSSGVGSAVYFEGVGGNKIRAQQASDGAILLLAFLALAHLPDPPNLLLLEEPENGIYPKRLGEVIGMLKDLVNRKTERGFPQIILSTHSPYVLSFFQPEEVTFLSRHPDRPEAGVRARPLRDAPNIRERMAEGEFYLGELWYNLSEEELFGEP